jgi:hypothetical protein
MASNHQRAKFSHLLWTKLREIGGSEIEIEKDPLGYRYQVNKHGLIVSGDMSVIQDTHARFIALLMVEGFEVDRTISGVRIAAPSLNQAHAVLDVPQEMPLTQDGKLRIGIY